jgi:riboflavin biosynthesis pyrimidine reductase
VTQDHEASMKLLERLYEAPHLPGYPLPAALERLHEGPLGFETPRVFANFVSSIDGVVALPNVDASPAVIGGASEADRFMMGLLRACAGAVLIGAGTLRAEPAHRWSPDHVYPQAADDFARLRRQLNLDARPEVVVVTGTGDLDPATGVLEEGALVLTTTKGAGRLAGRLPASSTVAVVNEGDQVEIDKAIAIVHSRGHQLILSEGGPNILGQLLRYQILDELFVTVSPTLFGRTAEQTRPGLVEGVDLFSPSTPRPEVLSVRRHRSHLFVRYSLSPSQEDHQRAEGGTVAKGDE